MSSPTEPAQPDEPDVPEIPDVPAAAEAEAARERAAFDELVASFHSETAPDPVPRWPVAEDAAEISIRARAELERERPPMIDLNLQPIVEPTDETTVDKYFEVEHFEPPEPPPFPEATSATKAFTTLVVGGVLFLLARTILNLDTPPWMFWMAVAGVFGGIIGLVVRMRPDRDDFDDPDHGAVI
jgi:hypothetical protein